MSKLSQLSLIPGASVRDDRGTYTVVDLLNLRDVLVENECGNREKRLASTLTLADIKVADYQLELGVIPREDWEDACLIAEGLRPLVEKGRQRRTKRDVEKVAEQLGKHPATIYRWLVDYEATGLVSSLLRKARSDKGKRKLDAAVEQIVNECIHDFYLTDQQRTPAKTAYEVRKRCIAKGLKPPDESTVRTRILAIDEEYRVRRRQGYKAADERFSPIIGKFPDANYPLAVMQVDHTPMDVIVVDDIHRKPIGRPYLTSGVDVFSKILLGFHISLDPPGALSTGLCIAQAILGKDALLHSLGIEDLSWPCWGLMRMIHTDNAKEFRGTMLGRAAKEYGIIPERRPKGRPKYGGGIERAFRTYMEEVHNELPGTTFSNPKLRREYDSEGRAVMTLSALETWFTMFILGVYHQRPHAGNDGIPPIVQWERGVLGEPGFDGLARGIPARYPDEQRLRLDFLPFVERTVQEYGIAFEGVNYWSDALRRFVHAKDPTSLKLKRQFICRYDPRDLSRIWMYDPDSRNYIEVPYRNLARPAISIWELRAAKKTLREDSMSSTNEELIFKTIDRMRELVASESKQTKAARRMQQRLKSWERSRTPERKPIQPQAKQKADVLAPVVEDLDSIEPFEDIREE